MSWRKSVRKQIDKAKSRRLENEATKKICDSNRELHEVEKEEIHNLGRSLRWDITYYD